MSQALCFNEVQFSPVNRGNQIWIRSTELARALGYSSEEKVSRLYRRNEDEFTPDMTQVVENVVEAHFGTQGNLSAGRCRIFSLRGCHLLAMFSRTSVAKEFRKWVLNVLDRMTAQQPHPSLPPAPRPRSTAIDRTSLRVLVTAWSKISKMPQTVLWPQICAHFLLDQINDLPVERIPDALAWVQMKIDDVQQRALPEVSHSTPCANITIDTKTYAQGRKLFERLEKLMKDFDTAKSFVLLWGNPGTRLMRLSPEKKALYDNATDAIRMSLCGLNMAQLGLRAAMRIRADHDFAAND